MDIHSTTGLVSLHLHLILYHALKDKQWIKVTKFKFVSHRFPVDLVDTVSVLTQEDEILVL